MFNSERLSFVPLPARGQKALNCYGLRATSDAGSSSALSVRIRQN